MKITGFNPMICSRHAEDIVRLFEDLGFETTHTKENFNGEGITDFRMKDANGFHVDVTTAGDKLPMPGDQTAIRINVDDFDEAMKFFTARGFFNPEDVKILDGGSSKDTILLAPSGFVIRLIQHIRE